MHGAHSREPVSTPTVCHRMTSDVAFSGGASSLLFSYLCKPYTIQSFLDSSSSRPPRAFGSEGMIVYIPSLPLKVSSTSCELIVNVLAFDKTIKYAAYMYICF